MIVRQAGLAVTQILYLKNAFSEEFLFTVGAIESVNLAPEIVEALNRIKQLEGTLGRKTLEYEILNVTVEYGITRRWTALLPYF